MGQMLDICAAIQFSSLSPFFFFFKQSIVSFTLFFLKLFDFSNRQPTHLSILVSVATAVLGRSHQGG